MTARNGQQKRDASMGGCSWAFTADSSLRELSPVAVASKDDDGILRRRYSKDLIQVGTYVHPVQGWTLDVTRDRLDEWAAAFQKMKFNGVPVEIVKDHSFRAEDKIGELVDVFRDGDVLVGIHEFVGQDSIDLAKKVGSVSIWLEQGFADGKGVQYGEVILHSSIVQQAIVPDQEGFVPVEVAAGRLPAAALSLSRHTEKSTMDPKQLKMIQKLLGNDKLTADDALAALLERHEAMAGDKVDFDKKLSAASEELAQLKAKNVELQKNADGEPKVDPDALEMLAEGTDDKIQAMVASAKITPAVALKLSAALVGPTEARNVRTLSRKFAGGDESLAKRILDALAENDPVKLAEQTKGQKSLGRETPDDGPAGLDQEVVDEMIAQSGAPKADDKK